MIGCHISIHAVHAGSYNPYATIGSGSQTSLDRNTWDAYLRPSTTPLIPHTAVYDNLPFTASNCQQRCGEQDAYTPMDKWDWLFSSLGFLSLLSARNSTPTLWMSDDKEILLVTQLQQPMESRALTEWYWYCFVSVLVLVSALVLYFYCIGIGIVLVSVLVSVLVLYSYSIITIFIVPSR